MGGGHQTRLCPDCARSNPVEGSADFPQARCHFSLNNSYEESNSSSGFVPLFVSSLPPSYPVFFFFLFSSRSRPILLSCFLDCRCTKLQCYDWNSSKSFNFMWPALGRGMFPDYEWRGRTLRGNTCDGVWEVWPRMQYGSRKEKPSDVEETFGTSCHLLNLFAVRGVFDLETKNIVNRCFAFAHSEHLRLQKG